MKVSKDINNLEKLFKIVLDFNGTNDRSALLSLILTHLMELTHSNAGTLYIITEGKLHFRIVHNISLGILHAFDQGESAFPPIPLDAENIQNVSAYAAIKNEVICVDDIYTDTQFNFSGPKAYDQITGYHTKAMAVFPICAQKDHGDEVLGVLQLINPINPKTKEIMSYYRMKNKPTILALTKIAANTLANLAHVTDLQMSLRSFAATMTQAIDERSHYNSSHTQNVAQYCEQFARYLGRTFPVGHRFYFDKYHIEAITLAALLHDIGKIITPLDIMDKANRLGDKLEGVRYKFGYKKLQLELDFSRGNISQEAYTEAINTLEAARQCVEDINFAGVLTDQQVDMIHVIDNLMYVDIYGNEVPLLNQYEREALSIRRGTLTAAERKTIEAHVDVTTRLLGRIPFRSYYMNVPKWATCHHEFLDGSGYPVGLTGSNIPLESCVITIMDIFDALIDTNRPYKKGIPIDDALEVLVDMAQEGKLHKELVDIFVQSKIWTLVERL